MQNNKLEIRQKLIFSSKITNENDTRNHLINCISYIYVLYIGTSRDARMFAPIFYVQHFLPPQTYYPPPTTHRQSPIPNPQSPSLTPLSIYFLFILLSALLTNRLTNHHLPHSTHHPPARKHLITITNLITFYF